MTDCTCGAPLDAEPEDHDLSCPERYGHVMVLDEFEAIVFCNFSQREADNLELLARIVERGNAALADLPPEGEWQS